MHVWRAPHTDDIEPLLHTTHDSIWAALHVATRRIIMDIKLSEDHELQVRPAYSATASALLCVYLSCLPFKACMSTSQLQYQ